MASSPASVYAVCLLLIVVARGYMKTCNISDYGAKGDNHTDNTQFIQSAIDDCAKAAAGSDSTTAMVLFPALSSTESVYLSGAIFLKSNIAVRIDADVRLLGLPVPADLAALNASYPFTYTRREGTMTMTRASLLNGAECLNLTLYNASAIGDQCAEWSKLRNVKLFGGGIIDGNGDR